MSKKPFRALLLASCCASFLGACSITPTPMTQADFSSRAKLDLARMFSNSPKLEKALTLDDVVTRVLEHNLDARARMMEEAIALGQTQLDNWSLLPKLTTKAGYSNRSTYNKTKSTTSEDYSYSSEKSHRTADLTLTWNILDFGVSYYNAKQNADRALIAEERRHKVINNLIKEAQFSFWRMAVAQELKDHVANGIQEAEETLENLKKAGASGLQSQMESLRMRKTLLESLRQLEAINQELSSAKPGLAALINVPPTTDFRVELPNGGKLKAPVFEMPIETMEEAAFINNPDIREQEYQTRISINATRKEILRILPGLNFSYARNYDDDRYMDSNRWSDFSAQITGNIFDIVSAPDRLEYSDANKELADAKRLAIRMAVLAQVHVANSEFINSTKQFERADELWLIEKELADHSNNRAQNDAENQINRVVNQTSAIAAELRRYQHFAQMQSALASLKSTIGIHAVSKVEKNVATPAQTPPPISEHATVIPQPETKPVKAMKKVVVEEEKQAQPSMLISHKLDFQVQKSTQYAEVELVKTPRSEELSAVKTTPIKVYHKLSDFYKTHD
ncbi:TolC family protein [Terasakiella sp. SH-1]|uniref:TolC family protein n=1 Tax=Terasakiella sp. SH-1 TaxID=2560057 RepID=UPI00107494E6|nr:TolC family protein [Terasakiella sp. SH-1]